MTSALLRWEAGVGSAGAGRQWHWRQAAGYSRVASSAAGADGEKCLRHSRVSWNDPHFLPLPARFRADVRTHYIRGNNQKVPKLPATNNWQPGADKRSPMLTLLAKLGELC